MTQSEIIFNRTQAIKFYGPEAFAQICRVAEQYMTDNQIPIPSEGIQTMPSFWATVKQLMEDDANGK